MRDQRRTGKARLATGLAAIALLAPLLAVDWGHAEPVDLARIRRDIETRPDPSRAIDTAGSPALVEPRETTDPAVVAAPAEEPAEEPAHWNRVRTIVIDPGHGGHNTGAMGFQGVLEKYITLQVAKRVAALLETDQTIEVRLTRTDDRALELRERTRLARDWNADLFVSIHANAATHERAQGLETYFLSADAWNAEQAERPTSDQPPTTPESLVARMQHEATHALSEQLALAIHSNLLASTGAPNRGVKQEDFTVLREATFPAVVVEMGFLTHPQEGNALLLGAYQDQIATALVTAFRQFDASLPAVPAPPTHSVAESQ